MANDVARAVEILDSLVGHHTAHLSPLKQIEACLWLARRCTETAEEIARDEIEAQA